MSRKLLLVSVLASLTATAFGQTSAPPNQNNTNQNQQSNMPAQVVVPPAGGTAWTGIGPAGGVLLSTPLATFDTPQPTAGISIAGRAGISNSTPMNTGLQSTLSPSSMVYVYTPGVTVPEATPAPESPALEAAPERVDLVPSSAENSFAEPPAEGPSLAEVAAMYKARKGTNSLRTYTNADVPRENAGRLTNIFMASNTPSGSPQSSSDQSAATRTSAQSQQTTAPQQSTSEQRETASASNPQPDQNQSANEDGRLPASSTLLPLLGLLGVASAGVGVWYRRRGR